MSSFFIDILIVKLSKYLASIPARLMLLIFGVPILIVVGILFLLFGDLNNIYEE